MYVNKLLLRTGLLTMSGLSLSHGNYFNDYMMVTQEISVDIEQQVRSMELVKYYSKVFQINEDVVLDKVLELTNNFDDYSLMVNYSMDTSGYLSDELSILSLVRDISKNPGNFDLTKEDIASDVSYEPADSCEDLVKKYSNLLNINKEVAMSIVYTECGTKLDSFNYLRRNNPAGMGPHFNYKNIEQGVVEFIFLLRTGYNCKRDSDKSFLRGISRKYCTSGTEHWYSMVSSHYNKISDDYYCYAKERDAQKSKKY